MINGGIGIAKNCSKSEGKEMYPACLVISVKPSLSRIPLGSIACKIEIAPNFEDLPVHRKLIRVVSNQILFLLKI